MWFSKSKSKPPEVTRELRERALTISPGELGIVSGPGHVRVWAVLMETGYSEAVVSLVCLADGTTSLYFSNGGGVVGGGQHQRVRGAADKLIALVDARADELNDTETCPTPAVGRVRFYARTFDGLRTAEADEQDLGRGRHALSPLFHASHAVIAAVRESAPSRPGFE
jgi:hypothetical protein